ncbi:MAG: MFS transporter [Planctomycetaceae bacterium]
MLTRFHAELGNEIPFACITSTSLPDSAAMKSKSPLLIIFITVFIDLLGFGIVLPLLPRYGKFFGLDGLLGPLMASFSLMQFLFAPVWGRLSDRIGRRPVLLVGLAGSTVFYGLFGLATSLGKDGQMLGLSVIPWLFIARIGAGIAGATIPTAQAYIADSTTAEGRGKGMALIGAAFGIGFTFGPLLGSLVVSSEVDGPPSPMAGYLASGLSAFAFLWAVARLPESLKPGNVAPPRRWLNVGAMGRAFSQRGTALLMLTIFLTTLAFAQFEVTLSLLTKFFGMADKYNFYIYAYVGLVLSLSQGLLVRRLSPKLGDFRMSLIGTILMTLGLMLIAITCGQKSLYLLAAIVPINVLGYSALTPSLQAMLSLRTSADEQGEILGVGQSMSALARIAGPLLGMWLFRLDKEQPAKSVAYPYWIGAGLMLLGVVLVLSLRSQPKQIPNATDE